MQRIIVDLPEPDGPITTMTSRRATLTSMPRSASKLPKRLTTPRSSIITSPDPATCVASANTLMAFPGHAGRDWPLARWRSLARNCDISSVISFPPPTSAPAAGSRGSS